MPQLSFPSSPVINATYTADLQTWKWDGIAWRLIGTAGPTGPAGTSGPAGPTGPPGGTINAASIAFTDGDTVRRVTITNATVITTSKLVCSIRRPDTLNDSEDPGYIYIVNVCEILNGSFDVIVACLDWGLDDATAYPPNETITLYYSIG
jgi:hypothetical protein